MEPYLEIILEDKIYIQRTPTSKFIEFTLDKEKICSYEKLPIKIKDIVQMDADMKKNPEKYFNYLINSDNTVTILGVKNSVGPYLNIPSEIEDFPVTMFACVDSKDFKKDIEYINMPNTIKMISVKCFAYCSELKYVNLSENIKDIPQDTFFACSNLKNINLDNIHFIGRNAFNKCSSLKKIKLPLIEEIEAFAFAHCGKLEEVLLGNNLLDISRNTFSGCYSLTEIEIPENVSSIEEEAFQQCKNLSKITFKGSPDKISNRCFSFCEELKEFITPRHLKSLGDSVFLESGLEQIYLNPELVNFSDYTLLNCDKLKEVTLYEHQSKILNKLNLSQIKTTIYQTKIKNYEER